MRVEKCDVLIIGSGAAGLRAAIEAHDLGAEVVILGKCKRGDAHTVLATGGINAALGTMDPEDNPTIHLQDTWKEGRFIAPIEAVKTLCKNGPSAIQDLIDYGYKFHREKDGRLTQRFFGAHTYRRTCFHGDQTGKELERVLVSESEKRNLRFYGDVYITSLIKTGRAVNGAFGFDIRTGQNIIFNCKSVVLATGGYSRVFRRSSSRIFENTGDGVKLALNAGAHLQDMEMVQFHPTGMLYPPQAEGILVTEAVRGEGGLLYNANNERFMPRYAQRAELGPRDVVARAIYWEVEHGRGTKRGGVWLDITTKPKDYILKRLPKMYEQFQHYLGIDISKERMEVAPTAHYSMGGIRVNWKDCRTRIDGLYAVGEATGGLHGANRLGGNSLLETIVFGKICGQAVAKYCKRNKMRPINDGAVMKASGWLMNLKKSDGKLNPLELRSFIQEFMWHKAGIIRDGKLLDSALADLEKAKRMSRMLKIQSKEDLIIALDAINILTTAEAIIRSALARKESRGAHYRKDFPEESDRMLGNLICSPSHDGMQIRFIRTTIQPKWRELMKKESAQHKLLE
jgi:succinate dehydrogenase / fumarate reductase, flavoprotein subunit